MSNIAVVATVMFVVLGVVIFSVRGLARLLLVLGILAIGLLVLLIWNGKLTTSDIRESVLQPLGSDQPQAATHVQNSPSTSSDDEDLARFLNSVRVRGALPQSHLEDAAILENRAAMRDRRVSAAKRLAEAGTRFESNGQAITAGEVLARLP